MTFTQRKHPSGFHLKPNICTCNILLPKPEGYTYRINHELNFNGIKQRTERTKNGISNFNFYNSDFVISSQKDLLDQKPTTNPNAFSSNNTTSSSDTFLSFLVIEVVLLPDCEAR